MAKHFPSLLAQPPLEDAPIEVRAPYDDALIATIATADEAAIDQALATAERLFRDRDNWISPGARVEILERAASIVAARAEELALEAAREGGKPLLDSRVEIARAVDGIKNCAECIRTETGVEIPMNINASSGNRLAVTRREPIGPVVAVSAFNHPFNLIVHQVGPAVASGCPVIVKPAASTPLSCMHFVGILHEAGLPPAWCQAAVTRSTDIATKLVTDPRVAFFSFIGSAAVGWRLRSQLAPGARAALEHGGAAPVIVAADADLEEALPLLAKGGFYHAGQVCVSVQRVFVQERIARQLAERLAELGNAMVVGDPTSAQTEVGPLISTKEVDRVHEWVVEARDQGAEIVSGGEHISASCYKPTVIYNAPDDIQVSCNEIFGPVICVYSYSDLEEAIERANDVPFAFQSAVFTADINTAMRCYSRLNASAVMINDHTAFRVDWMPFAGLRASGLGVGGIPYTYHDMQIEKMMVIRSKGLPY